MRKVINFSLALPMLCMLSFANSNQELADRIIGVYWSPKKDAKIEIYKKNNEYFGKTIWALEKRKDSKNPDASLKERSLLGVDLFTNFTYKDGSYENGKIYDPDSGKTYDCKMSFDGKRLKARGYIGISLFGRTEIFERIM